jgi:tetratricopeptide (TPR) repeat protein
LSANITICKNRKFAKIEKGRGMKKIDKRDLKSPDKFQQELVKGFQWTTKHSTLVGVAIVGFLVLGAGLSAKSYFDQRSEAQSQAQFYPLEKKLLEKKTAFQAATQAAAAKPPADPKKKNTAPVEPPAGEKPTGDFEKDYGPVATDMLNFIEKSPKSKAAKMAALHLSDVQLEYKKLPEAQDTLGKVRTDSNDLLSGLVLTQLGTVQANQNDCNAAVGTWQKVLSMSSAKSLHSAVKLKQGLCYESLNDMEKAQKLYSEVKADDKESAAAKSAEKYLRLLPATKKN